jgi:hypothetical protein
MSPARIALVALATLSVDIPAQGSDVAPKRATLELEATLVFGSRGAAVEFVQAGLGGLQIAASLRPWRSSTHAAVIQVSRLIVPQWPLGDECHIRLPDPACLPYFPDVRLAVLGWEADLLGGRQVRVLGALGGVDIGDVRTSAGLLRLQLAPNHGWLSFVTFGQFFIVPSFRGGTLWSGSIGLGTLGRFW